MRSIALAFLFLVASFSARVSAAAFVEGTVYDPFDRPIAGATVTDDAGHQTRTDSQGRFVLGSLVLDARQTLPGPAGRGMCALRLRGTRVSLSGVRNTPVRLGVFNAQGRALLTLPQSIPSGEVFSATLHRDALTSGVVILRVKAGRTEHAARGIFRGASIDWEHPSRATALPPQSASLGKAAAPAQLSVSAAGFSSRSFSLPEDQALGLEFTLYYPGQPLPSPVTVAGRQETSQLAFPGPTSERHRLTWAGGSALRCYEAVNDRDYQLRSVTYPMIDLDNGLVRVSVSPELGSRILYVEDKTRPQSRQMFATPASSDLVDLRKTQNLGGIKPSFAASENSVGALGPDGSFDYKAGYYTVRHPDGGVSVVMNMRFDYNQREEDCAFRGRYGDRPLVTVVTLKPGHSSFSVRYVGDNVNPTPRSDRIWNNAIFPFSPSSWIYPTKYAMNHCASELWDMTTWNGSNDFSSTHSYFALFPQYGFSGAYYTSADACHLRVADPLKVPGSKIYAEWDIPELWSSTTTLFEAPQGFVRAFEPIDMQMRYYMTRGMGKVAFANEQVAISTSGSQFTLTSPCRGVVSVYDYNGTTPTIAHRRIGPDTVLTGTLGAGVRVVAQDGSELCNVVLPLTYEDNRNLYNSVKTMADRNGCTTDLSPANLDARQQYHYELEDIPAWTTHLSTLASLLAVDNVSAADNADILMSMARAAYRVGGFGAVDRYLASVGNRNGPDKAYLQGLLSLERGQPADFSSSSGEGAYFRALGKIASGDQPGAVAELNTLIAQRPDVIRPRILRAYLTGNLMDAMEVHRRVPASLELWVVLKEMGFTGASERLQGLLDQNEMATVRAQDFLTEITTGTWRHERRYEYDRSWFENVSLPAFPDGLRY